MHISPRETPGAPRRSIAALAGAAAAMVWTQALAAVLAQIHPPAEITAGLLTLGALSAVLLAAVAGGTPRRWGATALAWGLAATAGILVAEPAALVPALAIPLMAPLCALGAGMLAARLPSRLDAVPILRQGRALIWLMVATLAVVQIARLATWAADPRHEFQLATDHPFWAGHECLPAYLYAAELTERGETRPWDSAHYPGLNPDARAETRLEGMTPEDPYLYPPQFLLPVRLAIGLIDHYPTLRVVTLAINFTLLFGAAFALCGFVGGRPGLRAGLAIPLFAAAFPTLYDLQFGQAHMAAVALAILAMLAFEGRPGKAGGSIWLGGALLAAAILTKIFPAILLVPLAARGRWRELGTTFAWGTGATALAAVVLGPATLHSFLVEHLPRLQNGSASDFGGVWPEIAGLVTAANQGVAGLVAKLDALGLVQATSIGPGSAGQVASRLFLVALALAAALGARCLAEGARRNRAVGWLALLGLASLASPAAFADYVASTAVWMAVMLGDAWPRRPLARAGLGVALFFQVTLLGSTPLGSWADASVLIPLSLVGQLGLFALLAVGAGLGLGWLPGRTRARSDGAPAPGAPPVTETSTAGHGSVTPCPSSSRPVSVP